MKTHKVRAVTATSPCCRGKSRFTLRGRKKKNRMIQGKLRIRSVPGAFLVLGIIVVVVGTALAVAGYWPYRISRSSIQGAAEGDRFSELQTSGWSLGAKGLLSTASFIHSERMKLLGPVIMGMGLFILICANTVLYENRDRETKMLLAQMHSVICSVSTAVPSADPKEIAAANSMAKHCQWVGSLPSAHFNILCLQQLVSSELLLQNRHPRNQEESVEGVYRQVVLQTEALHHQESQPSPSLHCNAAQPHLNTQCDAEPGDSFNVEPIPPVRLNTCQVSASSMSILVVEDVDVPAAQLRRCHSMSYRTNPCIVHLEEGLHKRREDDQIHQPALTRRETSSQICINIPGQVVVAAEEQTRRSWPRMDLGNGRRYLKLENKEDSVDKLLDRLEQQCSQWQKSFGSGPFQ